MGELSAEEQRVLATAANLRRAYGRPDAEPMPQPFEVLLSRLAEVLGARRACQGHCAPEVSTGAARPGA